MSFYAPQRRQDPLSTTVSDTLTDYPITTTTPDVSATTTTHKAANTPELGGSEAGFISLIVGLALIILISCILIFFLLRNWSHGGRTVNGKSGRVAVESTSRRDRFRRGTLFGFRSTSSRGDGSEGGRKGWVRAPGEEYDEYGREEAEGVWDARDGGMPVGTYDPYNYSGGRQDDDIEAMKLRQGVREAVEMRRPPRHDSSMTVTLSVPGQEETGGVGDRRSIPKTTTPDTLKAYPSYIDHLERERKLSDHVRHGSVDSAETMVSSTSFPGGTRFKEDL